MEERERESREKMMKAKLTHVFISACWTENVLVATLLIL